MLVRNLQGAPPKQESSAEKLPQCLFENLASA